MRSADITLTASPDAPGKESTSRHMNLKGLPVGCDGASSRQGIGIAPGGTINYMTGHAYSKASTANRHQYADLERSSRIA